MARPLRLSFENAFYHFTSRGNRREKIFYSDQDKEVFLKKLKEMLIKYSMICQTYCLMDNHYHLFIKTNQPDLSQGIHYLNSSYANWFRNKHGEYNGEYNGVRLHNFTKYKREWLHDQIEYRDLNNVKL